ncbi:aminotransferase class V-fold PLP-dependent enzyme [Ornithinimicrobium sediminis]|uniref:aminotransferase class V-fold PLP-dependent enzyme n=1 Tax=Ornithinimicrobium sediminis TaxID=2904603 RepID=UPI001E54602E|nr:aminotransferase class V-fold PLP-dependent enzyme [Ornithinimicrobium sediminis]MCE0488303.1 aminotransferase class V-fold PLP-dependent enzyme [Ornithinimicrobium sediminis]
MTLPRPDIDPDGLLEYSVVFTDLSLNHMSRRFIGVMQQLNEVLTTTYRADTLAVVPGGGTYGMEAVARQLATGQRCLIVRNGFFSYRWSQILEMGGITDDVTVLTARPTEQTHPSSWAPAPVEEVVAAIAEQRPRVVFAAHVETSAGIVLPDDYLRAIARATHEAGGLFVLDCIASGALWVNIADLGVDVLITAPQKGWSGSPGAAYVLVNDAARTAVHETTSTSFSADLKRWLTLAEGYVEGRHAYHATMPTDTLAHNLEVMLEATGRGLPELRAAQVELGTAVRALLAERGFASVAAPEYAASSVVVVHTDDPGLKSGAKFAQVGLQVAGGVPLMCGEPEDWSTFRLGLFGLDKLGDVDGTVARLADGLDRALAL